MLEDEIAELKARYNCFWENSSWILNKIEDIQRSIKKRMEEALGSEQTIPISEFVRLTGILPASYITALSRKHEDLKDIVIKRNSNYCIKPKAFLEWYAHRTASRKKRDAALNCLNEMEALCPRKS